MGRTGAHAWTDVVAEHSVTELVWTPLFEVNVCRSLVDAAGVGSREHAVTTVVVAVVGLCAVVLAGADVACRIGG